MRPTASSFGEVEIDVLERGPGHGQVLEFHAAAGGPLEQRREVARRRRGAELHRPRSTIAPAGSGIVSWKAGSRKPTTVSLSRPSSSGAPSATTRAVREHDDAVGEPLRLLHVVRGQQDRLAEAAQVGDRLPRLAPRGRVEAGRRLVEEDQLGVADQAEREVQAPPLAAGEVGARGTRRGPPARPARAARAPAAGSGRRRRRARSPRRTLIAGPAPPPGARSRSARGRRARACRGHSRARTPRRRRRGGGLRGSPPGSSCRRRWGRAARAPRRAPR